MSEKYCNPAILDAALAEIQVADEVHACSDLPSDYSDVANKTLAHTSVDSDDFSKSDGVVSGRRLTVAQQEQVPVANEGTATHVALVNTATEELLYVTTSDPQGLTMNSYVDFPEWSIEIEDPS